MGEFLNHIPTIHVVIDKIHMTKNESLWDSIKSIATIASAFGTLLAAIVTCIIAKLTNKQSKITSEQLNEMALQRRLQMLPEIELELKEEMTYFDLPIPSFKENPIVVYIKIRNVGKGAAFNVKLKGLDGKSKITYSVFKKIDVNSEKILKIDISGIEPDIKRPNVPLFHEFIILTEDLLGVFYKQKAEIRFEENNISSKAHFTTSRPEIIEEKTIEEKS